MVSNVTLIAPAGQAGGTVQGINGTYAINGDGTVTVNVGPDMTALLAAGYRFFRTATQSFGVGSPLPADLVSIVAAATPANGNPTIAAQPAHARKLQLRIVLGTPGTTNITAGTVTVVGVNTNGITVTEVFSLITAVSVTLKTANAFNTITSFTIAGYTASGSGTGNTFGVGVSNDFGIVTGPNVVDLVMLKASKVTKVLGTSNVASDDLAASGTVDTVNSTYAPNTAPAANGLVDYDWTYQMGLAD